MPSKYCPHCGTIITTSEIPKFCYYGCGSLAEQPILPEFKNFEERLKIIEDAKKEYEQRKAKKEIPSLDLGNGRFQMRLFGPEVVA